MADFRIQFVRTVEETSSWLALCGAIVLTSTSVTGFVLEYSSTECAQTIQVWLIGALFRQWARILVVYLSTLTFTNELICTRIAECLDVGGVVWLILTTIAVLPVFHCARDSPFLYFSCILYLGSYCLLFVVYVLMLMSLSHFPPARAEDRAYLLERTRRLTEGNQNSANHAALPDKASWKAWLESHGSYETVYGEGKGGRSRRSTVDTEPRSWDGQDGGSGDADKDEDIERGQAISCVPTPSGEEAAGCVICLSPFVIDCADAGSNAFIAAGGGGAGGSSGDGGGDIESGGAENASDAIVDVGVSQASAGQIGDPTAQMDEEDQRVIVRYPCHGGHCFHAHCLHSWLQSRATAVFHQQQRSYAPFRQDPREMVTCPICRERPLTPGKGNKDKKKPGAMGQI